MSRQSLQELFADRRLNIAGICAAIILLTLGAWWLAPQMHRKPPSIFDTPVDGVLDYLASDHFGRLSIEERLDFLAGLIERFRSMSQNDSAVASSFLAGLTGPANEKLVNNARVLSKDILLQGAAAFLAIPDQAGRDAYIDTWIVSWVRFGEKATGHTSSRSDNEILNRMSEQTKRDSRQIGAVDREMAQQIIDFWDRDVASVASPKEQAQIAQFFPAIRQRLVTR